MLLASSSTSYITAYDGLDINLFIRLFLYFSALDFGHSFCTFVLQSNLLNMEKPDKLLESSRKLSSSEMDDGSKTERSISPPLDQIPVKSDESIKETETSPTEEWVYLTGFKLWAVIGVVTLACFILLLDTAIIATVRLSLRLTFRPPTNGHKAIPKITSDFHSLNDVGWYGSSYLLARYGSPHCIMYDKANYHSAALTPMAGKIYTRYNSKVWLQLYPTIQKLTSPSGPSFHFLVSLS
jgi:hypothetical protein